MKFPFWRNHATERAATRIYQQVVDQARRPEFYRDFGVPDTLTGRFEMICLHVYLVLRRLKASGGETNQLSQALHDAMFLDIDRQLREMGIGDLGVGKRIKRLAASLYGRFAAYDDALDHRSSPADSGGSEAPVAIAQALRDNLYATAFNADDDDQLNDDREGGAVGGQDALAAGEAPSGQSSDRSEVSAPTDRQISQMASYVHRADRAAELLTRDDLLAGRASFPIP